MFPPQIFYLYNMKFSADKILREWSWRVGNGMPDVLNDNHLTSLMEVLYEQNYSYKFIKELVSNLEETAWEDQSPEQQRAYLQKHPGSKRKLTAKNKKSATDTATTNTTPTTPTTTNTTPTTAKKGKPKTASGKEWLDDKGNPLGSEEILKMVSTTKQEKEQTFVATKGSKDVKDRSEKSRKKAFGGQAGKGGGDTTIQEEMTNIGREITLDPNIKVKNKKELAKLIMENVKEKYGDSDVAKNPERLEKLANASIAGFDTANDLSDPEGEFNYNPEQPDGYPVNTTDSEVVRDTLVTQLQTAEKMDEGPKKDAALKHAKIELYAFQKHAGDKSITGKEGDADTMIVYQDKEGRDRVVYVTNKQSLNDQQSSGTLRSAKRAIDEAADSLGLSDTEKTDVKEIAQNQFLESNEYDRNFGSGVNKVSNSEEHAKRLATEQSQSTFAKAAIAASGKAKNGYPESEMTPDEKITKRKYIEKNKNQPEVQAKLMGMDPAPEGASPKSDEYKAWAADVKEKYDNKEKEFTDGEVCLAASQVTGVGRLKKGSQVRTNEKALNVTRDINEKMQVKIKGTPKMKDGEPVLDDDGNPLWDKKPMSVEEAAKELQADFDRHDKKLVGKSEKGKPDKKMYGGALKEKDFIEIATNPAYREMETAERQRGKDIANMQTKTVKNLYDKDKEAWEKENSGKEYPSPPPNGKRVQAYIKGYMNRVHLSGYVGGEEDGRKFAEMGQTSITPREMRQALSNLTNFEGDVNDHKALEKHLLENIQVYDPKNENTPFEMWYVYEDKTTGKTERRHIGTDTHRTGGDASKVAGQHGSDLQEGIEDVQPKEENI